MNAFEEEIITLRVNLKHLEAIRAMIVANADEYVGVIQQEDQWYAAGIGGQGLFIRKQPRVAPTCLFAIGRVEEEGLIRETQTIQLIPEDENNPDALPPQLKDMPIKGTVRRAREMWLKENIRLYLDTVEEVGVFLYVEAVVDEAHPAKTCREDLNGLRKSFSLETADETPASYFALLGQRKEDEDRPGSELFEIRAKNQTEIEKRLERLRAMTDESETDENGE